MGTDVLLISPMAGIAAMLFAGHLAFKVLKREAGSDRMNAVSRFIRDGAAAYLHRQHKTVAFFVFLSAAALALIFGLLISPNCGPFNLCGLRRRSLLQKPRKIGGKTLNEEE